MTRKQKKTLRRIIVSAVLYVLLLIIGAEDRGWLGLALFLIPSLLLGLLLRKPVIRLNTWISHNLELTKVM